MKTTLEIGSHCFVYRPDYSFSGIVMDLNGAWVRVAGRGSILGSRFDEWFPIKCSKVSVEPAAFHFSTPSLPSLTGLSRIINALA